MKMEYLPVYLLSLITIISLVWFFILVRRYRQTMSQAYRWPILIAAAIALATGLFVVVVVVMG